MNTIMSAEFWAKKQLNSATKYVEEPSWSQMSRIYNMHEGHYIKKKIAINLLSIIYIHPYQLIQ